MSDLNAGAGAHLELGPISLGAIAKLTTAMESQQQALADWVALEKDYQRTGPVFVQLAGSVNIDASSDPGYIDLGGPAVNRVWEVRQLVIGGITWATAVNGNAYVLVQSSSPNANNPAGIGSTQDHAAALPSVAFYSSGQFRVRNPNHIFIAILSGSASTAYQAVGDAFDLPDVQSGRIFET